ncbi:MAG: hypothetical protein K2X61_14995 [Caulobacteraceae bacterium]|nr:hypothetical protein [Caulobacteraceae bacterium]
MRPLQITFQSPHLANPREGVEPQPGGTLKFILVIDCDLDLRGDAGPGTPLAAALEEIEAVITNYPFDGAVLRRAI